MTSSYTTNKVLEKPGNGDYVDTWNVPVNGDMDVIDQAFGGVTSLNATGGSATLTAAQYRSLILSISGAMSGNVTYTIPSGKGGTWIVYTNTSDVSGGPYTVTFASGGGGTSVVTPRGYVATIYSDGTNIQFADNRPLTPAANSVDTAAIQDGAVTYPKIDPASIAGAAEFRANTSSHLLDTTGTWASAAFVALTDAPSISVDLSTGINFTVTLGGNRTLANPTNTKVGQSGVIIVNQDSTGGRTLSFNSYYKFANGTAPTISTSANSVNVLSYYVVSSSFIVVAALTGVA
ncbi:MAG: hypothetical protein AMJ56_00235 [Anaerolineae bacterium SG8_19]|nr:MAG: hypothetical protein AMJ56_00235 [Anaerolineae bacterium SG8_19]